MDRIELGVLPGVLKTDTPEITVERARTQVERTQLTLPLLGGSARGIDRKAIRNGIAHADDSHYGGHVRFPLG